MCHGVCDIVHPCAPSPSPPSCSANGVKSKTPANALGKVASNIRITDKSAVGMENEGMRNVDARIVDASYCQKRETKLEPVSKMDHWLKLKFNDGGSKNNKTFIGWQSWRQQLRMGFGGGVTLRLRGVRWLSLPTNYLLNLCCGAAVMDLRRARKGSLCIAVEE